MLRCVLGWLRNTFLHEWGCERAATCALDLGQHGNGKTALILSFGTSHSSIRKVTHPTVYSRFIYA